jgi:hypothetical protein
MPKCRKHQKSPRGQSAGGAARDGVMRSFLLLYERCPLTVAATGFEAWLSC